MGLSTESYTADGVQKTFQVSNDILSASHCRVHFTYDGVDHPQADSLWDLVGRSTVVFTSAPTSGYVVHITISSDGSGLDEAPSVLSSVVANMAEILLADDNALIATTKAAEATVSASEAAASATAAELWNPASYSTTAESDALYEPADATILKDADIGTSVLSPTGDGSGLSGISAGATGGSTDQVFYLNDQVITADYTIPTGQNAMTAGSVTINDGVTITISDGSSWTIV